MTIQDGDWPETVEAAASLLIAKMSTNDKAQIRATEQHDLIRYHFGWGGRIRNAFGLWQDNTALLDSSESFHPDDCSMKIIQRV